MRPWKLSEINYGYVKEHPYEVAVLPLGATEPHNLHLPYGTDCYEADLIGERMCEAAHERGAKVVLLPTIPYGTETNQMAFPLAMNVNPSTLAAVITDLVDSLAQHGIRKIVLLNSHGGNDLKPVLRELYGKTPAQLFLCNWYRVLADASARFSTIRAITPAKWRRLVILAYHPAPGRPSRGRHVWRPTTGAMQSTRFEAVNRGWVSITRPWHLLTTNTGAGNPHAATAEKGRRMVEQVVERLAAFLVELSAAKVDERFPY